MLYIINNAMFGIVLSVGADGMDGLITTGEAILKWMQRLGLIGAAISFCIGGYFLMFGGQQGRHKASTWFIGGAVGLVVVMGAYGLATGIDNNVKFSG